MIKDLILDWFMDHWNHFGYYPMDWESPDGRIYSWDECWEIIGDGLTTGAVPDTIVLH